MRRLALVLTVLVGLALAGCGEVKGAPSATRTTSNMPAVDSVPVPAALSADQLAKLTEATTSTTVNAPIDASMDATDGIVANVTSKIAVYDVPNGTPFASVPVQEVGNPTWLPVVGRRPGWLQVLLPSKPNGSSGWVIESQVTQKRSTYLIQVHLTQRTIDLYNGSSKVGTWRAAIGATGTPTPVVRTFLMGSITDPSQNYSPVILPLGTHSATIDTYGGGPGTVAIHTWPTDVYGQAVSHGCVRVPMDALNAMKVVPLGTIVLITNS